MPDTESVERLIDKGLDTAISIDLVARRIIIDDVGWEYESRYNSPSTSEEDSCPTDDSEEGN